MASCACAQGGEENDTSCYYDVLVIGRTGQGKSTLANKFIGVDPETRSLLKEPETGKGIKDVIRRWDCNENDEPYFETASGIESVTHRCKVLSNEIDKNRLLDTVGFADSELTAKYGVVQGNIQSFRRILQVQRQCELRFSRVVYFFPVRGPPRRADGTLQEEIKVMYDYFDTKIFDIMVVVATNDEKCQGSEFTQEDIDRAEKVFITAFEKISQSRLPKCPPVIYLPLNTTPKEISDKIVGAPVISDADTLCFSPEFPRYPPRVELSFENRCTRCAVKIVYQRLHDGTKNPVKVIYGNDNEEQYDNSGCHPLLIKYAHTLQVYCKVSPKTIDEIKILWRVICERFELPPLKALLYDKRYTSLLLTWLIDADQETSKTVRKLLLRYSPAGIQFLQENNITHLIYNFEV